MVEHSWSQQLFAQLLSATSMWDIKALVMDKGNGLCCSEVHLI